MVRSLRLYRFLYKQVCFEPAKSFYMQVPFGPAEPQVPFDPAERLSFPQGASKPTARRARRNRDHRSDVRPRSAAIPGRRSRRRSAREKCVAAFCCRCRTRNALVLACARPRSAADHSSCTCNTSDRENLDRRFGGGVVQKGLPSGVRFAADRWARKCRARERGQSGRSWKEAHHRSAAVCTGSSHSLIRLSSSMVSVIEQPAISSEVT